jgi:hypothetical protein
MNSFINSFVFVTAPEGRTVFYPFLPWPRGYVIGSDADLPGLRRLIATSGAILVALFIPAIQLEHLANLGPGIAALAVFAVIVPYYALLRHLLRGLQRSSIRLTLWESVIALARVNGEKSLAIRMLGSIAFAASAVPLVLIDRSNWPVAMLMILLFGAAAVFYAVILFAQWWILADYSPHDDEFRQRMSALCQKLTSDTPRVDVR